MYKIAITGNIASGKSQVEKFIKKLGYAVFDSDKIAHDILNSITDFYGYDVFTDGKIDRKKLGNLVFNNPNLKRKLEELIHPQVEEKIIEIFEKNKEKSLVFISVPLLYEAGFEKLFDKVILVTVDENLQLNRLMARNNLTTEEAMIRMNSQLPQCEKIKRADYVIENNSLLEDLENKILMCIKELTK